MLKQKTELKKVVKNIKKFRKERKLTLEKLAYYSDISKGNMSDLENGNTSPSLRTLVKIANGLECNVKDLLDD